MSLHSIVLIKQVPDTANISGDVMKEDGTVNRVKLPAIFNPEDMVALEMALKAKDVYGGTVTVVTMGPNRAADILREALFMGADKAYLISDRKFAGADTLATSYVLSEAVKKIGAFDILFAGRQAIDGDTAQVGPQTVEKLNLPQITYAEEIIKIENNKAVIKHKIDGGYQVSETPLPAMVTVIKDALEIRPAKAKRIMAYKGAKSLLDLEEMVNDNSLLYVENLKEEYLSRNLFIDTYTQDDLNLAAEKIGTAGSPTKVFKIESVVLGGGAKEIVDPSKGGMLNLIDKLMHDHILG